jgi:RHS repeat-associated protein
MTATATRVSPKRTSGRSTWRSTPNVRRTSKLAPETRQTNCSNIFRWYRSGWGRYTQDDPVSRYKAGLQGYFQYALQNPLRFIDPRGLYTVDGSCKACEALDPGAKNLSEYIIAETSLFCKTKLNEVTDVSLRNCIEESCRIGRVQCENCNDLGEGGSVSGPAILAIPALRKMFPIRTATVCLNFNLNYKGEAGNTVIHEWAHGCGYNPDDGNLPGIPGIPKLERPPKRVLPHLKTK